ncbi:hypothetical protein [Clostridium sp. VAP52]|uniref:hypothetical protein n=1 Tax=Clostridium sp. VAP52 TaxID=2949977 RepID=UPI0020794FBB|nr:hypothetical protein [Clostridium sp. VAP52]
MNVKELLNILADNKGIELTYLHINNATSKVANMDFGQDIEPTGEYMSYNDNKFKLDVPNWEYGTIRFNNPLVLEYINTNSTGWKKTLSEMFNNKKKKALSNAVIKKGYDAIITIDSENNEIMEIVNLKGTKIK